MRSIVILDLDGTLLNSLPDICAALNRSLARLSLLPVGEEECRMMIGNGAWTLAGRAVGERKDLQRALYDLYRPDYSANLAVLTRPYPGIGEMLETLRREGMRLTVVSNKDKGDAERVLARCFPGFPFGPVPGSSPPSASNRTGPRG